MVRSGDVVLVNVQFTDTFELKKRPAVVLFEEFGNVVIAGITSNSSMSGISLSKKDGVKNDSIIKLNYIFTVSEAIIERVLFHLSTEKKKEVFDGFTRLLSGLKVQM